MQRKTEHQTSGTVQEKKCKVATVKIKDNTGSVNDISWKGTLEAYKSALNPSFWVSGWVKLDSASLKEALVHIFLHWLSYQKIQSYSETQN